MRIAIVTQELMHNYGGTLQAYAMQEALRRLGHDPVTLDYFPRMAKWYYLLTQVNMLRYYLMRDRKHKFFPYPKKERRPEFAGFMKKHIVLTRPVNKYTVSLLKKCRAEAIVVGSDQVWRKVFHSDRVQEDLFLKFARRVKMPKVAYAASFGTDKWEFSDGLTARCVVYARDFTAISTREASGVELCRRHLGVEAEQMPDPTLLLDMEDYAGLCGDIPVASEPFLLAYILDMDADKKQYVGDFAARMGLKARFCTADGDANMSVEQWLAMFRDARFVITNSFHGTVFPIINNKDFYSIVNEWRGTDRFVSLLSHFGLGDRLLNDVAALPNRPTPVDWDVVNEIRRNWQREGYNFLKINLIGG